MSSPSSPFDTPDAHVQAALALARGGRLREAIGALQQVRAKHPTFIPARALLGVMLQEAGDHEAALRELAGALQIAPRDAALHEVSASVLLALQRHHEAEAAARSALSVDPGRTRASLNLAAALQGQQRGDEAIAVLRALLATRPDHGVAREHLARALLGAGQAAQALSAVLDESVLGDASGGARIAAEFCARAPHAQTLTLLDALLAWHPQNYTFILCMARTLHQAGRSSEAMAWGERAHALAPGEAEPLEMRAVSLIDRGDVEQGLAIYRKLVARPDVSAETASRYLILAHYDPAQDNDALFAAHTQWVHRFIHPFGAPFIDARGRDAQRPLRIGWISPRFDEGPVTSFFSGLLAAFDREHFVHCLMSLRAGRDDAQARLRALADEWHDMRGLDDAALLERLREANFDIVVDLAGHSFGHRLPVLAQRVAPVQLCWLDYFDTTAIDAMDGWISDAWLTPAGSPQRYTERVLRLDSGRFCYTPPDAAPPPQRSGDGAPVFGSFNRLAKLNDEVLDVWARILAHVPEAQLELRAHLLDDTAAHARTIERFAQRGVAPQRLRLHGKIAYAQLLESYRRIDIALDPFPFSGCTTTCDALWMGVPVITRAGTTFVARQSASLLARLGREPWIAADGADYVARAVAACAGLDELRRGRAALRELTRTTLCDATAQASDFAALLRTLWVEHCRAP